MSYLLARDAKFPWNFHNHMFFFNDNGVFHTEKNQARGGRGGGGGGGGGGEDSELPGD